MLKKTFTTGLAAIVFSLISLIVMDALTPYGSATSPDSVSYLDIAENIKTGHGWVATDFSLENYAKKSFVIERIWPPAYPVVLSHFITSHRDVMGAARLSSILFAITGLLIFLLLNTGLKWPGAFIGALLISITLPMILIHTFAWSETLFIPLTLLSVLAASSYTQARDNQIIKRIAWLAVLVVALIALAYTRYIGVVFFVLLPFCGYIAKHSRHNIIFTVVASVVYAASVGALLFSNYQITSAFSGGARVASDTSVIQNLVAALNAVTLMAFPSSFLIWFAIATVFLVGCFLFGFHKRKAFHEWISISSEKEGQDLHLHVVLYSSVSAVVYLVGIVLMRTWSYFNSLDVRLIGPAIPLFLISILLLPVVFRKKESDYREFIVALSIILLFAAQGGVHFNKAKNNWYEFGEPGLPGYRGINYESYTPNSQCSFNKFSKLVKENMKEGGQLVTENAIIWRLRVGVATLQIPARFSQEELAMLSNLPGGSLMVIRDSAFANFAETARAHQYFFEFVDSEGSEGFKLVSLPLVNKE